MLPTHISAFISTSSLWPKSDSCPLQCRKPESCLLSQHLPQKHGTAHSTAVSYGQQITGLPVSCSPPFSRFLSYTHSIRQGLHFRITVQHLDGANSISAPDRDSKHYWNTSHNLSAWIPDQNVHTSPKERGINWERAAVNLHLCFPPALTAISSPSIKPNASPNIDSKSDFEVLAFFSALSDGSGKREETARPKYAPNRWTCIMHTWYETCISRVSKFVTNHVPQETLTQMLM